jgi:hypothetical protein
MTTIFGASSPGAYLRSSASVIADGLGGPRRPQRVLHLHGDRAGAASARGRSGIWSRNGGEKREQ